VLTIYETRTFVAEAARRWSTDERLELFAWIARDTIPGHILRMIRKELEDGIDEESQASDGR
jgi:hypothetical protein